MARSFVVAVRLAFDNLVHAAEIFLFIADCRNGGARDSVSRWATPPVWRSKELVGPVKALIKPFSPCFVPGVFLGPRTGVFLGPETGLFLDPQTGLGRFGG